MKKLAFIVVFALVLALLPSAAPASAAEVSKPAPSPVLTADPQTQGPLPWLPMFVIVPYCSVVQGTLCAQVGTTKSCTDICSDKLTCTCILFNNHWIWNCQQEC